MSSNSVLSHIRSKNPMGLENGVNPIPIPWAKVSGTSSMVVASSGISQSLSFQEMFFFIFYLFRSFATTGIVIAFVATAVIFVLTLIC